MTLKDALVSCQRDRAAGIYRPETDLALKVDWDGLTFADALGRPGYERRLGVIDLSARDWEVFPGPRP